MSQDETKIPPRPCKKREINRSSQVCIALKNHYSMHCLGNDVKKSGHIMKRNKIISLPNYLYIERLELQID